MAQLFPAAILTDVVEGFPKTCQEVQTSGGDEGYHFLDPDQDGPDPISVFCNMSSSSVTVVLHHNQEEWAYVNGYEDRKSYEAWVSIVSLWPLPLQGYVTPKSDLLT